MFCRFDKFRKGQGQMAEDALEAIRSGQRILCHAPTGIGKTDAAIGAALTYAYENGMAVFFVTPKNSQHRIVIDAVNGINKKYKTDFIALDLVGKRSLCTNENVNGLEQSSFYYVCDDYCTKNACEYYTNSVSQSMWKQKSRELGNLICTNLDAEEYAGICHSIGVCGYEATMKMAKNANLIVADYNHVFYPEIFSYLCSRALKTPENSILIVDEAHNLAQRLNSKLSRSLSVKGIRKAYEEAKKRGFSVRKEIAEFYKGYSKTLKKALGKEKEALLEPGFFDFYPDRKTLAEELLHLGQKVILEKRKMSYMALLGDFIQNWDANGDFTRVGQKKAGRIMRQCLDVRPLSGIINDFHSAVLMSGTLTPMEMHEQILGLKDCLKKQYQTPFSRENALVIHIPGYTSRYSRRGETEYGEIADKLFSLRKSIGDKIVVYFPSFAVLSGVGKELLKNKHALEYPVLMQHEGMKQKQVKELVREFNSNGGILLCVLGGSLAEGIEFKDNSAKGVVIVGLPLEQRGLVVNERIKYFESVFGNGEEYGYDAPAMIKVVQACGRLIRSERDYGAIVFLEDRIAWSKYRKFLPEQLEFMQMIYPETTLKRFMEEKKRETEALYGPSAMEKRLKKF